MLNVTVNITGENALDVLSQLGFVDVSADAGPAQDAAPASADTSAADTTVPPASLTPRAKANALMKHLRKAKELATELGEQDLANEIKGLRRDAGALRRELTEAA